MLAAPEPSSNAPLGLMLLAQPCPAAPELPHGHATPLPSPKQNGVTGVEPCSATVIIALVASVKFTRTATRPLCANCNAAPSELPAGAEPNPLTVLNTPGFTWT